MEVSLIIPIYNQADSLKCVLESIKYINFSNKQYEIVVIDDGSSDNIKGIIKGYQNDLNIRYLCHESNKGRAAARNTGANAASGDILIFTDGDRVLSPDFLREHYQMNREYSVCMGKAVEIYSRIPNDTIERFVYDIVKENMSVMKYAYHYAYQELVFNIYGENGKNHSGIPWISLLSGNFSIRKKIFQDLGGFDENFQSWGLENIEFGYRAYKAQVEFLYNEKATNYHLFHQANRNPNLLYKNILYFYNKYGDENILKYYKFISGEVPFAELDHVQEEIFYHLS